MGTTRRYPDTRATLIDICIAALKQFADPSPARPTVSHLVHGVTARHERFSRGLPLRQDVRRARQNSKRHGRVGCEWKLVQWSVVNTRHPPRKYVQMFRLPTEYDKKLSLSRVLKS
jgi:hypothetical protein